MADMSNTPDMPSTLELQTYMARLLDVLMEGPILGGPWRDHRYGSAVVHATFHLFGEDASVRTRTDGTDEGNHAYHRYQCTLIGVHELERLELVALTRDPQDGHTITRIALVE